MNSSTPGYDSAFPSSWTLQDDENDDGKMEEEGEEERQEVLFPSQAITPSRDNSAACDRLHMSPIPPFNESAPPTQYLPYFPSSWILSSDAPVDFLPENSVSRSRTLRPHTQAWDCTHMQPRRQTAHNLGSRIASWEENARTRSMSGLSPRGNRVETFRHELSQRMSGIIDVKDSGIYILRPVVQTSPLGRDHELAPPSTEPRGGSVSPEQEVRSGVAGNDNDTGIWGECVSIYSGRLADAPHLPPPVAAAYSTRTTSSVLSG